jgi:hypothetical protein
MAELAKVDTDGGRSISDFGGFHGKEEHFSRIHYGVCS